MIRRFFRHLGESIKNLKRNLLSTLTAVFSVMIVLSLLGVFGSVILQKLSKRYLVKLLPIKTTIKFMMH